MSSHAEFTTRWYLCQLEVLECKMVPWPNADIVDKYSIEDCGWPSQEFAYECKINLLTGRTHQVSRISFILSSTSDQHAMFTYVEL